MGGVGGGNLTNSRVWPLFIMSRTHLSVVIEDHIEKKWEILPPSDDGGRGLRGGRMISSLFLGCISSPKGRLSFVLLVCAIPLAILLLTLSLIPI